jgi:hypothetical protein
VQTFNTKNYSTHQAIKTKYSTNPVVRPWRIGHVPGVSHFKILVSTALPLIHAGLLFAVVFFFVVPTQHTKLIQQRQSMNMDSVTPTSQNKINKLINFNK